MDILLTTRLTGRSIVWGTFLGLWRSIIPFAGTLAVVLLIGVVCTAGNRYRNEVQCLVPCVNIAVYFSFVLALGMHMSLACRNTGRAIGWTLVVLLFLAVVLPLVGSLLHEVFNLSKGFEGFVIGCSPSYWILAGPSGKGYSDCGGQHGYVLSTLAYIGITVALLRSMIVDFDRRVGRQPHGKTAVGRTAGFRRKDSQAGDI